MKILRKCFNLFLLVVLNILVFTFFKYGPSELFSFSVSDQYNFQLPLQQDLDRELDTETTSTQSQIEHRTVHEDIVTVITSNTSTLANEVGVSDSYDEEYFLNEMETRREWKQNVCERSNKASRELLSPLMERVVYYVKSKNFLWCPVFKAASTNWMQNIMLLSDLSKRQIAQLEKQYPQQPNQQARQAAPFIKKKQIKTIEEDESSFRFIVTRHPFHRLLSAFRDKFERCIPDFDCTKRTDWYYHRQGKGIVDKYRKLALNKFGKIFFSKENNYGAPFPVAKRINEKLPSWWEFIQHVLSVTPSRFDEHFKPIHLLCSSCAYDFNFILRYENISIEEPFLVQQLGAEGIIKSKWENSNKGNVTEKQLIEAYFDLLSNSEINRLYDIYRLDFKQFNYTFTFRGITYNDLSEKH